MLVPQVSKETPGAHRTRHRAESPGMRRAGLASRGSEAGEQDPATPKPFHPSSLPWSCPGKFLASSLSPARCTERPGLCPGDPQHCRQASVTASLHFQGRGAPFPEPAGPEGQWTPNQTPLAPILLFHKRGI